MNLEHLEAFRVELLAERERVDRLLESLAAFVANISTFNGERSAFNVEGKGKRTPSPRPSPPVGERESKERRPKGRSHAERWAEVRAAIVQCGETFEYAEVAHRGGWTDARAERRVASQLRYLAVKGVLTVAVPGKGPRPAVYLRGPEWGAAWWAKVAAAAGAAVPAPRAGIVQSVESLKRETAQSPAAQPEGRSPTERMTNALLGVVSATPLSADQVIALVLTRWPGLWTTPEQKSNLRMRLMDLAGAMRITREGRGPEARYSRRGTPPAAREDARPTGELKIHVPRDADAGVNDNDE